MVTHCLCHDVSFEHLRRAATERGLDLAGLKAATGCCTGCTMCEPYVRLMLKTGRTSLPVLSPRECAEIMSEEPDRGTTPPTRPV